MVLPVTSTQQCCTSGRSQPSHAGPSTLLLSGRRLRRAATNGTRCTAMFKNFKNPLRGSSEDAGLSTSMTLILLHVSSAFHASSLSSLGHPLLDTSDLQVCMHHRPGMTSALTM